MKVGQETVQQALEDYIAGHEEKETSEGTGHILDRRTLAGMVE